MTTDNTPSAAGQAEAEPVQATPMIEAEHLSKFYGIFAATRDVSFTVNRGEVVAFPYIRTITAFSS